MKAGKSDQEIIAFLTQRYGDFILYKPRVTSRLTCSGLDLLSYCSAACTCSSTTSSNDAI